MQRKRNFTKRRKVFRRKRRTGRRGRSKRFVAPNNALGFPTTRLVKMRYVVSANLDAPIAGISYYNMRANDLYDPDAQTGGHQPIGFDQWSLFYKRFTVVGSKAIVRYNSTGNSTINAVVGIMVQDSNSAPTSTYSTIIEQGKGKWKYVAPTVNGSNVLNHLRLGFSTKKWFNVANIKDNQGRLSCTATSSPTDQAFFTVWSAAVNQSDDQLGVQVLIQIDYLVLCSEPLQLTQS